VSDDERTNQHILSLNATWQSGHFDQLANFYHPDVVLLPPDAGAPITGRGEVVASYQEFADAATLHEFQVTSMDTFVFDDTAVCHMRFEIEYETDSGRFRESGLEIYVVVNATSDTTQPAIVWRSQAVLDAVEILPRGPED
jgi:ketosteroid isomerase-like protein